nr:MAG TPA: hypothetical protein [Caudoviricetes sp.]
MRGTSERGKTNPLEGAEDTATPASRPCINIRTSTAHRGK